MTHEEIEKAARQALDNWHREVNTVAMASLDPEYRAQLKKNWTDSRVVADCMVEEFAKAAQTLVARAYEEGARVADAEHAKWYSEDPMGTNDPYGLQSQTAEDIAKNIRALKDSLVQETVSSQ